MIRFGSISVELANGSGSVEPLESYAAPDDDSLSSS